MTFPFREHPDHNAPSHDFCIFCQEYWELFTTPDDKVVLANDECPFNFPRVKGWQCCGNTVCKGRTPTG